MATFSQSLTFFHAIMNKNASTFPASTAYQEVDTAETYDEKREKRWLWRYELNYVRKQIAEIDPGKTFMDIPCGTGRFTELLADRFRRVCGCDISNEMIDVARKKMAAYDNVDFQAGDATSLPFDDNAFDCCMSVRFFGHTPTDVRRDIFKELARVTSEKLYISFFTFRIQSSLLVSPCKVCWVSDVALTGIPTVAKKTRSQI